MKIVYIVYILYIVYMPYARIMHGKQRKNKDLIGNEFYRIDNGFYFFEHTEGQITIHRKIGPEKKEEYDLMTLV